MSSEAKTGNLLSPTRRGLLVGAAALSSSAMLPQLARAEAPATAAVNTTGLAVTDTEVTVGILHSVTGTMAISETGSVEAEKLAIEQINAQGGVLGRKIKFIQEDGASDWPTFAEKAKKLLVQDKCASVMGCWTSASRKAVLPVFEQYNGMLYYPTFYEGLEQSKNVIYTGQEATQQILAGLNWVTKEKGAKTFYLLGSDYIWPRTSNKIARKHIENVLKLKVAGEEYFPLGSTQFNSVINKMKLVKPDVIYAIIVGGSNVAFYKQLKAAGIDLTKQTLMTISVTEDEILGHRRREYRRRLRLHEIFRVARQSQQQGLRAGVPENVGREDRHRRRHPGRLSRPLAMEADGGKGRQLRHRQDRRGLARRRIQGRAGRLCAHPREPSLVEQNARRPRAHGRPIRCDLRDRRPDGAGSFPEGIPVSA
jgi:ABC-type branched-subunit amino acid transport system substrate-binding protein